MNITPSIKSRFESQTDKMALWARDNKLVEDPKTAASMVPVVAAGGVFYALLSMPKLINDAATFIGNGLKKMTKPIPVVGSAVEAAVDTVAGSAHVIVAGVAGIAAYMAFKTTNDFDPKKAEHKSLRGEYATIISKRIDMRAKSVIDPEKTLEERVDDIMAIARERFGPKTKIDRLAAVSIVERQEARARIEQGESNVVIPPPSRMDYTNDELKKLVSTR